MPTKAVPPRKRVRKTQNITVPWPFLAAFSNVLTIKEMNQARINQLKAETKVGKEGDNCSILSRCSLISVD